MDCCVLLCAHELWNFRSRVLSLQLPCTYTQVIINSVYSYGGPYE